MIRKNIVRLIRIILLIGIIIAGISYCIYIIPSVSSSETSTVGYRLSENSNLDVWFVGDSNLYSGIIPQVLYKDTNLISYNSGESGMRMNKIETYTKDMYQYQLPKLIVLETDTLFYSFDDTSSTIDEYNTFDKIYYNHDFWRRTTRVSNKGYYFRADAYSYDIGYSYLETNQEAILADSKAEMLEEYIEYVRSMGSDILFMALPAPTTGNDLLESQICEFCEEEDVNFLDFNYPDLLDNYTNQIDIDTDCHDESHLNFYGAYKATDYLAYYIENNYDLAPYGLNTDYESSVNYFYKKYADCFSYFN